MNRRAMEQALIPMARPSWNGEMREAAIQTLDSGRWVKGPHSKNFGQEFADYIGVPVASPCQSGTASLWASLRVLGIGEGDEVIVPSMTFISTATSVSLVGAKPVFVDVENDYWCICPKDLEAKITENTKAVIAVHLYGQMCSPIVYEICQKYGLALIEDAAQAHGASQVIDGKKLLAGAIGDVGCFSFFPSKNMSVGGEGGMLTCKREDISEKVRTIVDHGRGSDLQSMHLGSNLRMPEVLASIGRVQLKSLDVWVERRNQIAENYDLVINQTKGIQPPARRETVIHAFHQYIVVCEHADSFRKHMDENQISTRVYYTTPCHRQPIFSNHPQYEDTFPVTEAMTESLVAIPVFHEMTDAELERITTALGSYQLPI